MLLSKANDWSLLREAKGPFSSLIIRFFRSSSTLSMFKIKLYFLMILSLNSIVSLKL